MGKGIERNIKQVGQGQPAFSVLKQKSRRLRAAILESKGTKPYAADLPSVLMHLVHSVFCTRRPFSITETFWRLGLNARLVARWEKERL